MPQKLNKAGQMQDYIPKGNGDASGEYGTSNGTNKNFTTSDKKKTQANVITENKSVVVENKGKTLPNKALTPNQWKKVGNLAYEKSKPSLKIAEEIWKLQDEYGYDVDTAIKKLKENYQKESQEKIDKEEQDRLDKILRERGANETYQQAKESNYFGYGSVDALEKAHKNDYEEDEESKANIIDDDLTGKTTEKIEKLNTPELKEKFKETLKKAVENAKKAEKENNEDGGTANLDSFEIYLKNANFKQLEEMVKSVDPKLTISKWDNGVYHIFGYEKGQGNLNTRMVEAFEKTFDEAGFKTYVYSQMD